MNLNVYLDEPTVDRLNALARKRGTTRNALVREAVVDLLDRNAVVGWPEAVRAFDGEPGISAFEGSRKSMRAPSEEPLA